MLTKGIYPPLNNEQIHSSSFCMSDFLDESLPINYICPVFSLIHLSSPEKNLSISFIHYAHLFNSISHLLSLPHNLTFKNILFGSGFR